MGFLKKLTEEEKPKEVLKKEKQVEIPAEKPTTKKTKKEKGLTQPEVVKKEAVKTDESEEKNIPPVETEKKNDPASLEIDKTNYGGIGIVGEHREISRFKALVKFHGKGKVNQSIGRILVNVLKEWNDKNPM